MTLNTLCFVHSMVIFAISTIYFSIHEKHVGVGVIGGIATTGWSSLVLVIAWYITKGILAP